MDLALALGVVLAPKAALALTLEVVLGVVLVSGIEGERRDGGRTGRWRLVDFYGEPSA
jgi:hypothetical protein